MTTLSDLLQSLENKIALLENSVAQASSQMAHWTSNHQGLIGMLQGTKEALHEATKLAHIISPDSSATEGLDIADRIIESLGSDVNQ